MWNTLGIEATGDAKAIKRAYANQLKRINPEEEPDVFQTLRFAYEQAIVLAQNGWADGDLEESSQMLEAGVSHVNPVVSQTSRGSLEQVQSANAAALGEKVDDTGLWTHANEQAVALINELNATDSAEKAQNLIEVTLQDDWFVYVDAQLMFERCLVEIISYDLDVISTFGLYQIVIFFNWEHPEHPLWQGDPYKMDGVLFSLRYQYERVRLETPANYDALAGFVAGIKKKPNYLKFHLLASTIERKAVIKEQINLWLDECPKILEVDCNHESVKWWREVVFDSRPLFLGNTWFGAARFSLYVLSSSWLFIWLNSIHLTNPLVFAPILLMHCVVGYQVRKFIYEKTQWHLWVKHKKTQLSGMLMQFANLRVRFASSGKGTSVFGVLMLSLLLMMSVFVDHAGIIAMLCYILLGFWWGWQELKSNAFMACTYPVIGQLALPLAILSNGFFLHLVGCWVIYSLSRVAPTKFLARIYSHYFLFSMWALPLLITIIFKT